MSLTIPFLRASSPIKKREVADDESYYSWEEEEDKKQRKEVLSTLASAIRAKSQWYFKILQQKELPNKWTKEAQVEEGDDLEILFRDLKSEARRICILDHTAILESPHLDERPVDYESIVSTTGKASLYLRSSKYGIDKPQLFEDVGAYYADDVVPMNLHNELVNELDALAALEPKDYHPGSSGQVQDLIHPSLYPYMIGVTPLRDGVDLPPNEDGKFITKMDLSNDDSLTLSSAFAWIPTAFQISEDGQQVDIQDYINGLGPRDRFPVLYSLIEQVFRVVMPMLEKTASHELQLVLNESWDRWDARKKYRNRMKVDEGEEGYESLVARQKQEKANEEAARQVVEAKRLEEKMQERTEFYHNPDQSASQAKPETKSKWAGKQVKIIVKAANYILQPGQEYSGTWHMEGMPHERIVASAIYYYERDPTIIDAGLYLRRKRDIYGDFPSEEDEHRQDFEYSVPDPDEEGGYRDMKNNPSDYGSDAQMSDLPGYINVGIVPTTASVIASDRSSTGRIVTFPNWVQHRVVNVKNDYIAEGPAKRKILCFFLVDDSNGNVNDDDDVIEFPGFTYRGMDSIHVLTASDVPPQARACNALTLALLLTAAFRKVVGKNLPGELAEFILAETNGIDFGLSREQAEERRRALMADRRVQGVKVNDVWQESYSLCEH